jgi:hypothetical protein
MWRSRRRRGFTATRAGTTTATTGWRWGWGWVATTKWITGINLPIASTDITTIITARRESNRVIVL